MDPQKTYLPTVLLLLHHIAIGMDHAENTTSQLLHCCLLQSCSLATGMFTEPFPSNGCLCCLHSSCLEEICHNTLLEVKSTLL
jgi:hypothetical protein